MVVHDEHLGAVRRRGVGNGGRVHRGIVRERHHGKSFLAGFAEQVVVGRAGEKSGLRPPPSKRSCQQAASHEVSRPRLGTGINAKQNAHDNLVVGEKIMGRDVPVSPLSAAPR
jgi:hypothetical protein